MLRRVEPAERHVIRKSTAAVPVEVFGGHVELPWFGWLPEGVT